MNKSDATAKAFALSADYMRPYAVVKYPYGYDAEQYNTLISPAELVQVIQPPYDIVPELPKQAPLMPTLAELDADEVEIRAYFTGHDSPAAKASLAASLADIELLRRCATR